jgi:hypothetical protein
LENATNKEENTMNLPQVVSREEWLAARKELLVKEKDLTRYRDEVNADRRQLPMVRRSSRTSVYRPVRQVGKSPSSRSRLYVSLWR